MVGGGEYEDWDVVVGCYDLLGDVVVGGIGYVVVEYGDVVGVDV